MFTILKCIKIKKNIKKNTLKLKMNLKNIKKVIFYRKNNWKKEMEEI